MLSDGCPYSSTETIFQEDSTLFSPMSFPDKPQYTHDEAEKFCRLNGGHLVKITDGVKYNEAVKFAHLVFANITERLKISTKFELVNLRNVNVSRIIIINLGFLTIIMFDIKRLLWAT